MSNTRRGFTLIELLVAVFLMVLLTTVVVYIFSRVLSLFTTADARAQIFQNVRSGVDMMRRDLMSAEPYLREDGISPNGQRLRVENGSYVNAKWATAYPNDALKVWKVRLPDASGNVVTSYVKYWLDTTGERGTEIPVLKRRVFTAEPNDRGAGRWADTTATGNDPASSQIAIPTQTSDISDDLMQYVVGFDVEPYYPNSAGTWNFDPFWNLDGEADAATASNEFKDGSIAGTAAKLYIVRSAQINPTDITSTTDEYTGTFTPAKGAQSIWTAGALDASSILTATSVYYRRAVFATAAPTTPNWTTLNERPVNPLPRGFRLTFYVRDERSREQRSISEVVMIPCWGG